MKSDYQSTLDWLFTQLPMYQRVGGAAYKADLDNTLYLMDLLDEPQKAWPALHVAGTNGKGSVSHLLASSLQAAGYKVGLYTSPHLCDFRERIRVNGQMIPEQAVVDFVARFRDAFQAKGLSFFEMTVGLAFDHFRSEEIDIAVVEVGMGGRLDSTNVVEPLLSIITNIGLDHQAFLGNDRATIAGEKAGIIKKGVPVVIGQQDPETQNVFEGRARLKGAPLHWSEEYQEPLWPCALEGPYQAQNQRLAQYSLKLLAEHSNFKVHPAEGKIGFAEVSQRTGLKGRWETLRHDPQVIADTGHNREALEYIGKKLQADARQIHIVWGTVQGKDQEALLRCLPASATFYFCAADIPRALPIKELAQAAQAADRSGATYPSVWAAYQAALASARPDHLIYVGGSTFTVAEVLCAAQD